MKRILSGIKPTGKLHLGNYIGAIKEFVKYQDEYDLYVFIADLHALTIYNDPNELRENTKNLIATYLAAGLDPNKCTLFKQSDVAAQAELGWVLACNSNLGELSRMTQYKAKVDSLKNKESIGTGIYIYPTLMAADILAYDADAVPTGVDQKQHVELTRDIAERFNKLYGDTFKLPEPIIPKVGAKIMSLSDPTKKMSKSESDKGTIYLLDDETTIRNKIKKAVTDCEDKVYYNPETKPGVSNLMTIYSALTNKSFEEIEEEFKDIPNYGIFKTAVADVVVNEILKLQSIMNNLKNSNIIEGCLEEGWMKASMIADEKRNEVFRKVGLI